MKRIAIGAALGAILLSGCAVQQQAPPASVASGRGPAPEQAPPASTTEWIKGSAAITAGVPYDVGVALLAALPAFVVSVASHYGLWKATGVSAAVQSVGAKHLAD